MTTFRSKKHYIYTQIVNKEALSCVDDKRFQIENSNFYNGNAQLPF